jgi:RNA polymerase sigma-70 factor (ECF subfamily)
MIGAVVARVLGLPRGHADVEDGISETFRRLVEGLDRVRPGEPVGPWAAGIARHVALDQVRARKRAKLVVAHDDDEGASPDHVDPSPGPEEQAMGNEQSARVRRALATLSEDHREALLAFHVDGLAYQEIAAKMGVPMGTVATWISRARKAVAVAVNDAPVDGKDRSR